MCTCAYIKGNAMTEESLCRVVELEPGDQDWPLQIPTTEAVVRTSNPDPSYLGLDLPWQLFVSI